MNKALCEVNKIKRNQVKRLLYLKLLENMNTYLIVDISGKVLNYDYALCTALCETTNGEVVLAAHLHDKYKYGGNRIKLLSFVPKSYQSYSGITKRIVKAVEGTVNYIILLFYILMKRPNIIHFQWFPFMEFSSFEIPVVRMIRCLSRKSKIVLTIHNIFPHGSNEIQRNKFRQRFLKMDAMIDHYIVHTENTAKEVHHIYGLKDCRVSTVPHGIFKPNYQFKQSPVERKSKKTIIFYGVNRRNKGGDILIDAVRQLPEEYRKNVRVVMAGKTSDSYLAELKEKADNIDIEFIPTYIPDQDLYQMIDNADYVALPYREISQSGVLLLALYFRKPLLISDLPSFCETLRDFTKDMFFETGNAMALRDLIIRMLSGKIDAQKELQLIEQLNRDYSWENSASKTLEIYQKVTN